MAISKQGSKVQIKVTPQRAENSDDSPIYQPKSLKDACVRIASAASQIGMEIHPRGTALQWVLTDATITMLDPEKGEVQLDGSKRLHFPPCNVNVVADDGSPLKRESKIDQFVIKPECSVITEKSKDESTHTRLRMSTDITFIDDFESKEKKRQEEIEALENRIESSNKLLEDMTEIILHANQAEKISLSALQKELTASLTTKAGLLGEGPEPQKNAPNPPPAKSGLPSEPSLKELLIEWEQSKSSEDIGVFLAASYAVLAECTRLINRNNTLVEWKDLLQKLPKNPDDPKETKTETGLNFELNRALREGKTDLIRVRRAVLEEMVNKAEDGSDSKSYLKSMLFSYTNYYSDLFKDEFLVSTEGTNRASTWLHSSQVQTVSASSINAQTGQGTSRAEHAKFTEAFYSSTNRWNERKKGLTSDQRPPSPSRLGPPQEAAESSKPKSDSPTQSKSSIKSVNPEDGTVEWDVILKEVTARSKSQKRAINFNRLSPKELCELRKQCIIAKKSQRGHYMETFFPIKRPVVVQQGDSET